MTMIDDLTASTTGSPTYLYGWDGTNWDRVASVAGTLSVASPGGLIVSQLPGWSFANLTSATTTTVKSGAGVLHAIVINKGIALGAITMYDNTAASGTKIGTITFGVALLSDPPVHTIYDVAFTTGLTIVTGAATDITVAYR